AAGGLPVFRAIIACIKRVISTVSGAAGTASSIVGAISEWIGHAIAVPGWAWLIFCASLLFATACRIEWELMQEKDKNRKPRPDMPLKAVITRIRGKEDIFGFEKSESMEVFRALTRIREHAVTGQLTIFGVRGFKYLPSNFSDAAVTRLPIPS